MIGKPMANYKTESETGDLRSFSEQITTSGQGFGQSESGTSIDYPQ
jgi:hypothetical protein